LLCGAKIGTEAALEEQSSYSDGGYYYQGYWA
jgi:hypothetical protein